MDRNRSAAFLVALAVLFLLPVTARATTFSFGDIDATDTISSIQLAAGTASSPTVVFTTVDDRLVFEASVSTINFANKPSLSPDPGDVIFKAEIFLTGSPTFLPPVGTVTAVIAQFTNGVTDFTLMDFGGGPPVSILEGDFTPSFQLGATIDSGVRVANVSADFDVAGGDADAVAAFASAGRLNSLLNFGSGTDYCGVLTTCPTPTDLLDFDTNPTATLVPVVPEPHLTTLLLSTLLLGTAAVRRRTRRSR